MNYFRIKTCLFGLFITYSSVLSAQTPELTSSSADGRGYFEPLDEVVITGAETNTFFGKTYHYFVPWGLDHYHTMKGMQYFSPAGREYLDLMREYQRKDGLIWSFLQTGNRHYYETCYGPFGYFGPFDGKSFMARQPIENHCEYIYVNSVYMVWKASDSWDFQVLDKYLPDIGLTNRMLIHPEKSKFGIFYGDNTGYADACEQLAEMFNRVGDRTNAEKYGKRATEIMDRINKLSWNGRFFTHFIEENDSVVRDLGVDESTQISLSNAYTINRKGITSEQRKAIIQTYLNLKNNLPKGSPGEWYAIYPPFERGFGDDNEKWQYMNGGVAGHAAGELARGAYENGYETYATDILNRLQKLGNSVENRIWFAYTGAFPDPAVPDYTMIDLTKYAANNNRSAIGISNNREYNNKVEIPIEKQAACIYLMHSGSVRGTDEVYGCMTFVYEDGADESICLMRGKHIAFKSPLVAPRWASTSAGKVKATAYYPASGGYIAYEYEYFSVDRKMAFDIAGNAASMDFHILLPKEMNTVNKILSNDKPVEYTYSSIESSKYVDFTSVVKGVQHIEIFINK